MFRPKGKQGLRPTAQALERLEKGNQGKQAQICTMILIVSLFTSRHVHVLDIFCAFFKSHV